MIHTRHDFVATVLGSFLAQIWDPLPKIQDHNSENMEKKFLSARHTLPMR